MPSFKNARFPQRPRTMPRRKAAVGMGNGLLARAEAIIVPIGACAGLVALGLAGALLVALPSSGGEAGRFTAGAPVPETVVARAALATYLKERVRRGDRSLPSESEFADVLRPLVAKGVIGPETAAHAAKTGMDGIKEIGVNAANRWVDSLFDDAGQAASETASFVNQSGAVSILCAPRTEISLPQRRTPPPPPAKPRVKRPRPVCRP